MEYPEAVKHLTLFKQKQEKDSDLYKAIEVVLNEVTKSHERIANISDMLSKTVDEKIELRNELFYIKDQIKKEFDFTNVEEE